MVEDDEVLLARGRAPAAADHLPQQPEALGRAGYHDGADVGDVPALGEDAQFVRPRTCFVAKRLSASSRSSSGRRAVDVLAGNAGADELVADVDRVADRGRIDHGLAVVAVLVPGCRDVGDEVGLIHAAARCSTT